MHCQWTQRVVTHHPIPEQIWTGLWALCSLPHPPHSLLSWVPKWVWTVLRQAPKMMTYLTKISLRWFKTSMIKFWRRTYLKSPLNQCRMHLSFMSSPYMPDCDWRFSSRSCALAHKSMMTSWPASATTLYFTISQTTNNYLWNNNWQYFLTVLATMETLWPQMTLLCGQVSALGWSSIVHTKWWPPSFHCTTSTTIFHWCGLIKCGGHRCMLSHIPVLHGGMVYLQQMELQFHCMQSLACMGKHSSTANPIIL